MEDTQITTAPAPEAEEKLDFKKILPIFVIVFIDLLGLTIIIPLLPLYAASFRANAFVIGALGAAYPIMQFLGAPLLGMYPLVPLTPGSGLGIAMFRYEDKLCWGLNADYELVPDIQALADDVCASLEELRAAVVHDYLERRTAAEPERTGEPSPAPAQSRRKEEKSRKKGRKRKARAIADAPDRTARAASG